MNCTLLDGAIKEKSSDKMHKKWSFLLKVSSANLTKYTGKCVFCQIHLNFFNRELHFLCAVA